MPDPKTLEQLKAEKDAAWGAFAATDAAYKDARDAALTAYGDARDAYLEAAGADFKDALEAQENSDESPD